MMRWRLDVWKFLAVVISALLQQNQKRYSRNDPDLIEFHRAGEGVHRGPIR